MFCWPCITVYQYSDWPCITVYQYSDWPCITVYQYMTDRASQYISIVTDRASQYNQYSYWPCITVYQYSDWPCITDISIVTDRASQYNQYSDWPCITVYQYSDWPCITVYQYSETNVMHVSFSLLRIKGLYTFRALLSHPQEALHNGTWYIACMLCQLAAPVNLCSVATLLTPTTHNIFRTRILFNSRAHCTSSTVNCTFIVLST
jgi:hypothetical protein